MITNIIIKEIQEKLQSLSFQLTFLAASILIGISVFAGYQIYRAEVDWYQAGKEASRDALAHKGSYQLLLDEGNRVMRAPTPLSIFARGVDSVTGKAALVNKNPVVLLIDSRFGQNPIFALFGELDLNFIVTIILALFAILFSYNAISGERELGTLKQVFSTHLSRARFLLGKAVGGYLTLALTYVLPVLLSLILLITMSNLRFSPAEYGSLSLLFLIHLLYLAVFYCIGLLMSALTRHSLISLLLSLFAWVLFVAVVPRAAIEVASMISPPPPIEQLEKEKASIRLAAFAEAADKLKKDLNEIHVTRAVAGDADYEQYRSVLNNSLNALDQHLEAELEKLYNEYLRKQNRLISIAESISRLTPMASVIITTTRLADTDVHLVSRLQGSITTYRKEFIKYAEEMISTYPEQSDTEVRARLMFSLNKDNTPGPLQVYTDGPSKPIDISAMPRFSFEAGTIDVRVDDALLDVGLLALEAILIYFISFFRFARYDIR